ncbi:MAG: alpha/beta fold hydrolase [Candidatus Peribacteraceae bacterium]|nr:alpha/beta fold hydrolase [Candidatus Peribacteraceae bacterium]MDD5742196.1 alpha/beta fold hydrolase [Candidatus Peribacteraceae bacterium]
MRTRMFIIGCALLLTACSSALTANGTAANITQSSASSTPVTEAMEQVPAELSITHFATMRLEGTGLTLGDVLAQNAVYTRYAITYRSNGLLISGIMNIPKGTGPFPLVVLAHGYIDPAIYTQGRGLKREQDFLAREGFAVLHTDYRGHAGSDPSPDVREVYDAGLEYGMDVINAVNAVRAAHLPHVDARRVGILGHSLGGGVALNIAVARPDLASAFVLYAPVNGDAWQNFERWHSMRDEKDRTRAVLGTRKENPAAWDALSSFSFLGNITAPILLAQGTADADVPPAWSDDLNEKLKTLGKDIAYVSYEGEKHEFIAQWDDFMRRVTAFFRSHLAAEDTTTLLP